MPKHTLLQVTRYLYGDRDAISSAESILTRLQSGLEFQALRVKYHRYLLDNMDELNLYDVKLKDDIINTMTGETNHNLYLYGSDFDDYQFCQRVYNNRDHIWRFLGINNVFFVGSKTHHELKVYKVLEDEVVGTGDNGRRIDDIEYLFKKIQESYNPF